MGNHPRGIRRVLDDVPQRADVERPRSEILVEQLTGPDAQAVVARAPLSEPPVRLASLHDPPARAGRGEKRAGGRADVEQPSTSAMQGLDPNHRFAERPLAHLQLRDVRGILTLRIGLDDVAGGWTGTDVLQPA